jgi:hypothetical protein
MRLERLRLMLVRIAKETKVIENKNEQYIERLNQRQIEILRTLEYLNKEQRTLAKNKHSIDRAAYESRRHLLDSLADWYANESTRIDHALVRMRRRLRHLDRLPAADRTAQPRNRA